MFVILSYDVNEKRVQKVNSVCSKYLFWYLNSVFCGNISKEKLEFLFEELKLICKFEEDKVICFCFPNNVKYKIRTLGIIKNDTQIIW